MMVIVDCACGFNFSSVAKLCLGVVKGVRDVKVEDNLCHCALRDGIQIDEQRTRFEKGSNCRQIAQNIQWQREVIPSRVRSDIKRIRPRQIGFAHSQRPECFGQIRGNRQRDSVSQIQGTSDDLGKLITCHHNGNKVLALHTSVDGNKTTDHNGDVAEQRKCGDALYNVVNVVSRAKLAESNENRNLRSLGQLRVTTDVIC